MKLFMKLALFVYAELLSKECLRYVAKLHRSLAET